MMSSRNVVRTEQIPVELSLSRRKTSLGSSGVECKVLMAGGGRSDRLRGI